MRAGGVAPAKQDSGAETPPGRLEVVALSRPRVGNPAIGHLQHVVPPSIDVQEPDLLAVVPAEKVDTAEAPPCLLHAPCCLGRFRKVAQVVIAIGDVVQRALDFGRVQLLQERNALLESIEPPRIALHRPPRTARAQNPNTNFLDIKLVGHRERLPLKLPGKLLITVPEPVQPEETRVDTGLRLRKRELLGQLVSSLHARKDVVASPE